MSEHKALETVTDINKLADMNNRTAEKMLAVVTAESLAMAMHNAVAAQHNARILNAAIVTAACNRILTAGRK